jgi:hypothetical protein
MVLASAGAAVLGALLVIWACALPILESGGASISLFSSGNSGWYMAEPIMVVVLGLAGGAVILGAERKLMPQFSGVVAAGALIGVGALTFMFFAGYELGGASGAHAGSGGLVGMLAGLLLGGGGVVSLLNTMKSAGAAS